MKFLKKTLRWIVKSVGLVLTLIILVGLAFKLFGPERNEPLGKLVDIDGLNLHINSTGEKNNKPTLVVEAGLGMATEYYHWLSQRQYKGCPL